MLRSTISASSIVPISLCYTRHRLSLSVPLDYCVSVILYSPYHTTGAETNSDPKHIVLAGDSAGAGLCLALLLIIRDQSLPMPAGACLISPWVDLTHSFPSITQPSAFDYVPSTGFHAKPSLAWPPPTPSERHALGMRENPLLPPDHVVLVDGNPVTITEQVNMYAPNAHLPYALVSPVLAASLGGFCACQVVVGGAEILRDEQIFLAHKMAAPTRFPLSEKAVALNGETRADMARFPPTDVEVLVFDDGPHAAPTLGYIEVAKFQYRAVARFAAWALAKAEAAGVEDSGGAPSPDALAQESSITSGSGAGSAPEKLRVGLRAGDALSPFEEHMRRYRVDRQGGLYDLEAPDLLPALTMPLDQVGDSSGVALKGWIEFKKELDIKFASEKRKGKLVERSSLSLNPADPSFSTVFIKRRNNAQKGYMPVPNGEVPPPSALVGRRVVDGSQTEMGSSGAGSSGVGNSLLGKLFRRMEKGGPAAGLHG